MPHLQHIEDDVEKLTNTQEYQLYNEEGEGAARRGEDYGACQRLEELLKLSILGNDSESLESLVGELDFFLSSRS